MKSWIVFLLNALVLLVVLGVLLSWIASGIDIKKKNQKGNPPE
jgi:hypothetical protein